MPLGQAGHVVRRVHVHTVVFVVGRPKLDLFWVLLTPFFAAGQGLWRLMGACCQQILHDFGREHDGVAGLTLDLGLQKLGVVGAVFDGSHHIAQILRFKEGLIGQCHHQPLGRQALGFGQANMQ